MTEKICIIPNNNSDYDVKMVADFAEGLRSIGIDAHHSKNKIIDQDLNSFVSQHGFNTVIRINAFPPLLEKRVANFRHISWFQDVFLSTGQQNNSFRDGDMVVTLGRKDVLGLEIDDRYYAGAFNLYINPADFSSFLHSQHKRIYDFNMIGFIPFISFHSIFEKGEVSTDLIKEQKISLYKYYINKLFSAIKGYNFSDLSIAKIFMILKRIINFSELSRCEQGLALFAEQQYDALTGTLDIHKIEKAFRDYHADNLDNKTEFVDFCTRELPRFLDRYYMMKSVLKVSENTVIYGNNWENYPAFASYHQGSLTSGEANFVFSKSKITLQNNNHGIGLHSRTLSAMAAGGFVFTHQSPRDGFDGGMTSVFEPGIHFGNFTVETLEVEAKKWLRDDLQRENIARNAQKLVLNELNWTQGAKHFAKLVDIHSSSKF